MRHSRYTEISQFLFRGKSWEASAGEKLRSPKKTLGRNSVSKKAFSSPIESFLGGYSANICSIPVVFRYTNGKLVIIADYRTIMEEIDGEELVYIKDVAIAWGSGAALFFLGHRSVGKGGNTSTVVGHCIL
jgi:hypothetical protein